MALAARKHRDSVTVDRQPKSDGDKKNGESPQLNKFETYTNGSNSKEYSRKAL